jgi:hypothetical protein
MKTAEIFKQMLQVKSNIIPAVLEQNRDIRYRYITCWLPLPSRKVSVYSMASSALAVSGKPGGKSHTMQIDVDRGRRLKVAIVGGGLVSRCNFRMWRRQEQDYDY